MILCKCDRCGKIGQILDIIPDSKYKITTNKSVILNLCSDCEKDFEQFLKAKIKRNTTIEKEEKSEKQTRSKNLDDGKILALRKAGWSYDKIAEELKCSPQTVANHLKAMENKENKMEV